MKKLLLAVLFTTAVTNVQAASLSSETLPYGLQTELQGCAAMGCEVIPESLVDIGGMSAYAMINPFAADPITWLIRYNLTPPSSHLSTSQDYISGKNTSTATAYSGSVWLTAGNSYNPLDPFHQFTIYTDTASPTPNNYYNGWGSNPNLVYLGLTTTDLVAGRGFAHGTGEFGNYSVEGNLSRNPSFWTCVECGWRVDFNLIYLDYSSGTLNFNPNDTRGLLFAQSDYWVDFSNSDQFYVQPVPIPPTLLLFGSGLLGLLGLTKRSRR